MTGPDPSDVVSRLDRFRNVRVSDPHGCGRFGGGLVAGLADRAVLVGCVFFVTDGFGRRDAGQNDNQGYNPAVPVEASPYEPPADGSSFKHL